MKRIGDRDRCTAAHEDLSAEIEDRVTIDLRQHPVERVAFAESTLFDGGSAIADLVESACDRRGVGHGTVAPRFPRVDQWTDTRLECAAGLVAPLFNDTNQRGELRRVAAGRQFRVATPRRDHRFDARRFVECRRDLRLVRSPDLAYRAHEETSACDADDREEGRRGNHRREFTVTCVARIRSAIDTPINHAAQIPTINTENHLPYTPTGENGSVAL